jgi:hypothetical protein
MPTKVRRCTEVMATTEANANIHSISRSSQAKQYPEFIGQEYGDLRKNEENLKFLPFAIRKTYIYRLVHFFFNWRARKCSHHYYMRWLLNTGFGYIVCQSINTVHCGLISEVEEKDIDARSAYTSALLLRMFVVPRTAHHGTDDAEFNDEHCCEENGKEFLYKEIFHVQSKHNRSAYCLVPNECALLPYGPQVVM